jgi:hypothetical protein
MHELRKTTLYSIAVLPAIGLALSAVAHVSALSGKEGPLGNYTMLLHIGIFVVWLPAILASRRLTRHAPLMDYWKAALRGCPAWMRYALYALFAYAVLNFVLSMTMPSPKAGSGLMTPSVVRGFSGHWMVLYATAAALLYSAANVKD